MEIGPFNLKGVANEKKDTPPEPEAGEAAAPPKAPLPIIPLLHTVALLGALGLLFYSKFIFKRPAITESGERKRLAHLHAMPAAPTIPAMIKFPPLTVNIAPFPDHPLPADGTSRQLKGKLHYITMGFSLEVRDKNQTDFVETIRPLITDKVISILGKKEFNQLNLLQGRYLLHSQLIDAINQIAFAHTSVPTKEGLATNLYFTEFLLQ